MLWFSSPPNPNDIRRQAAICFLHSLTANLPGDLNIYLFALEAGQSPESVFSELGLALADLLRQQQNRIVDLLRSSQYAGSRIEGLLQETERLRNEPVRQLLGQARQQIHDLTRRAENAERDLDAVRRTLEAEQSARRQESETLQKTIVAQNSIIARQQLRLNALTGAFSSGKPSDTESSEG